MLSLALAALAAFTLLLPAAGQAQTIPPLGDSICGLYNAPDFTGTTRASEMGVTINTQVTVYIVMTGCPIESVSAFECLLTFESGSLIIGTSYPTDAINVSQPPEFIVGFGSPLGVTDGVVSFAELTVLYLGATDEKIYLNPTTQPSIPGAMAYVNGMDDSDLREMFPSSGDFANPAFGINFEPMVATEDASWTDVKNMFR
jgi:hypothetical protein